MRSTFSFLFIVPAIFYMTTHSASAQLPAESEWEITNLTLFQRSNATLKNIDGKISMTVHLRGGRKREYTGQMSETRLTLTSSYENTGSTEKDRKCHDYIMNNASQFPEYNYVLELQLDSLENFSGKLHQPTRIICNDEGVVTKIEVQTNEIKLKRIKPGEFRIYTQNKDTVDVTANFSNPFPEVTITSHTINVRGQSENKVSLSFSAKITDVLADIVDGAADIREVYLEYLDLSTENIEVSKPLTIQRSAVNTTKWRPYAHEISVDVTNEAIPLLARETYVNIRAVNALGNETTASVIIMATEEKVTVNEEGQSYESKRFTHRSHKHRDGIGSGYAGPVQINLTKLSAARPSGDDVEIVDITYRDRTLEMIPDPDNPKDFYLQAPLMALDSVPSSLQNAPNIVAVDATGDFEMKYKTETRDLYWNYTAHSPSNIYTYAIGLTYTHNIYSRKFNDNKYTLLRVLGIYEQKTGKQLIGANAIKLSPGKISDHRPVPGRKMEFKIPYKKDLIGKTAAVKCILQDKKGKRYKVFMGAFKIGTLKTIIVGVDGLSFSAAKNIVSDKRERGFKFAFDKNGNDDAIMQETLSAIPTITWCNWSGIYSGQPPGKHGITGNSYLSFNSSDTWIYNKLHQLFGSVASGFNDAAHKEAGSLYDDIAKVYPNATNKLDVYSAYPWYSKSENRNVSVSSNGYIGQFIRRLLPTRDNLPLRLRKPSSLTLFGHDPKAARLLDLATASTFKNKIAGDLLVDNGETLDVVSLYFPGPDNVAHHLGKGDFEDPIPPKKEGVIPPKKTESFYFEPGLSSVRYSFNPNTINVVEPLESIEEHMRQVTDFYFHRTTRFIRNNGLSYATMFVLTSDHGLHAYHNDAANTFNLFPKDVEGVVREDLIKILLEDRQRKKEEGKEGFYTLFKNKQNRKGIKSWNNTTISTFVNSVTNYSPNGGMGHFYIRTGSSDMDNILVHKSAGILYMAATRKSTQTQGKRIKFNPKKNKVIDGKTDDGAFGKIPAIFVKACPDITKPCENRLKLNYRWVKRINRLNGEVTLGSIEEFLNASGYQKDWLDFEARLEELNDRSNISRSGDIIVFTDGAMGYLTLIEGDQYNGWHGGATLSESLIPMFINIPGKIADESFIKKGFEKAHKTILQNSPKSKYLRNWHLAQVLTAIYSSMEK